MKKFYYIATNKSENRVQVYATLYEYEGIKYFIDKRVDSGHYVASEYYTGAMIASNKKLSLCKFEVMDRIDKCKDYILKEIKERKHVNN